MNILYCGDKPMQKGIMLSAMSVVNNVHEQINIYILTINYCRHTALYRPIEKTFADFLQKELNQKDKNVSVTLIDITQEFTDWLPKANMNTRFTACCMLRLFADKAGLPDRVLYLDTDVLCRNDFTTFYYQDMSNVEIAGVSDYYGRWVFGDGYINSGVMLMNIEQICRMGLLEKCRIQCRQKEMFMPDQTAINTFATGINLCSHIFNDQRRLHSNTVFQHFTTTFRIFPVVRTITVKPWEVEKMHQVLDLHEYDNLLDDYSKSYERYIRESAVPVFYSVNEKYAPYLAVSIKSLAENCSAKEHYRIIVMCDDVKNITKIQLTNVLDGYENIDIQFVDVWNKLTQLAGEVNDKITDRKENRLYSGVFTMTIYLRIFLADIFPEIDKAVYIDADTVLNGDIKELFDTDIGENMFGAVNDTFAANHPILSEYIENVIGTQKDRYVNSGVLLMNMDKMRKDKLSARFLKLLDRYHFDSVAPDQDYINAMCKDDICYLDREWNVMPNKGGEYISCPKLIHYNLFDKPWNYREIPYEEYFWYYAYRSGFYPMLLRQREQYDEVQKLDDKEKLDELLNRAETIISDNSLKFSEILKCV